MLNQIIKYSPAMYVGKIIADPISSPLTTPTVQVEFVDRVIHKTIQKMHSILMCEHSAVGLASNQIGESYRMFVYKDINDAEYWPTLRTIINPALVYGEDLVIGIEGCLSFPDTSILVERYRNITVKYVEFPSLNEKSIDLENFPARLFQHEMEHLDGRVFIDNLTEDKRNEFLSGFTRNYRSS